MNMKKILLVANKTWEVEPFIFISAITDREGHFDEEVTPNAQAQNYTSAYNGGIVAAWLLPKLPKWFA